MFLSFVGGNPLPQAQHFREAESDPIQFVRLNEGEDGAVGGVIMPNDIGPVGPDEQL